MRGGDELGPVQLAGVDFAIGQCRLVRVDGDFVGKDAHAQLVAAARRRLHGTKMVSMRTGNSRNGMLIVEAAQRGCGMRDLAAYSPPIAARELAPSADRTGARCARRRLRAPRSASTAARSVETGCDCP